ncbi:MAG TPA: hypothetical protein VN629_12380, partial [Castellaniella sp.]|nr:hypothetical protein [Castellaniella sp.]
MEDNDTPTLAQALLACLLACTAILGLIALTTCIARAHDAARPELDSWYMGLQSVGGHPCCEGPGKDATHLSDVDWESKDGHYRVRIEGQWYDVPNDAVIEGPNRDG